MATPKQVSPDLAPGKPCPICGRPAAVEFRPFCSARCKDVDLNRWLSGAYHIPTNEQPKPQSDKPEDDD